MEGQNISFLLTTQQFKICLRSATVLTVTCIVLVVRVVSKDLLFREGDFKGTKLLTATVWPVLLTLLLAALLQVGYHDDGGRPLLPHQPPEVNKHVLFWA